MRPVVGRSCSVSLAIIEVVALIFDVVSGRGAAMGAAALLRALWLTVPLALRLRGDDAPRGVVLQLSRTVGWPEASSCSPSPPAPATANSTPSPRRSSPRATCPRQGRHRAFGQRKAAAPALRLGLRAPDAGEPLLHRGPDLLLVLGGPVLLHSGQGVAGVRLVRSGPSACPAVRTASCPASCAPWCCSGLYMG